ncbi:MAG: ComEA family DNA-binding protein [Phycisphaerae bacterium]|nr:ComEA family DNA-binding protein [Phycisphaerae bacterium]
MIGTQYRGFVLAAAVCGVLGAVCSGVFLCRVGADPLEIGPELINPNTADAASLARLPNIGPKRAQAIVAYRQNATGQAAAFRRAEDMEKVSGIGPKTVDRMRPWLIFD